MNQKRLKDLGEKEIIRTIIKPLFNPKDINGLAGDDCAVIDVSQNRLVCVSTDRVPADLISFKLGIIDYFGLGYYLAILNISDLIANGANPVALLLTFAFDENFLITDFKKILHGVKKACDEYGCQVMGGDLSNSLEMSISATSIGTTNGNRILYRKGAKAGDRVFCSNFAGLTSTAFQYFLEAKPKGLRLPDKKEALLKDQFRKPRAMHQLSKQLAESNLRVTCMDNTDGIGQSFSELAEINELQFILNQKLIPIHPVTRDVAEYLGQNEIDIALGGGADFQLLGTICGDISPEDLKKKVRGELFIIGELVKGNGLLIKNKNGCLVPYKTVGWNYYSSDFKIAASS